MELIETFDKYLTLPRERAYNQYLDERNLKIFRVILIIFSITFAIFFTINLVDNQSLNISLVLILLNLVLLVSSVIIYKKFFNLQNIRKYIFGFLIFQLLMFIAIGFFNPDEIEEGDKTEEVSKNSTEKNSTEKNSTEKNSTEKNSTEKNSIKVDTVKTKGMKISVGEKNDDSFVQYVLFIGIMVLIFRLSRTEIIQLFATVVGVSLLIMLLYNSNFSLSSSLPNLITATMFFIVAIASEKKRQKNFNEQYDVYYAKNYENIRMKKELNYAREIQLSMLPQNNAVIGEIEISALSLPASEVGGDYFDYFRVSDTEIGFFICDVSGHGVASALLLSGLRSCMHLIMEESTNPKEVLEKLNRMIRKTQSRKMFVTAIFAIIDTEKNKCKLYNAGHLPPYKISENSKDIYKIKKHGVALGAMNTVENTDTKNEVVFDFYKGDKLILYTDGVNEAMDSNKTEYGLENLEIYLNNNSELKTNELLNGIVEDVRKFTNNNIQRDDLTLLIIKRN